MSHYEKRLEADLEKIRGRVKAVGSQVEKALTDSVHALLTGDRAAAYRLILADLPINREVRSIDRDCHAFVARHLPSAGHLRFVSSVLRLIVELERIGDYAATICREAVQLTEVPTGTVARDLELMGDQSRRVLDQAMRAWNESNAELARGTVGMAKQAGGASHKVFEDLLREGRDDPRPLKDLFALLVVFNRLDRVVAQAKNICEETLFSVAGETKAPKRYRVLFIDEKNDGHSQLAEAYARKAYPLSGEYRSAGWVPAEGLEPRCQLFMDAHGLDSSGLAPSLLEPIHEELAHYHVIVSLVGDPRPHVPEIPFHTVLLEWDAGPSIEGLDQERAEKLLEEAYERIAHQVRELMETLRGEEAG
jgi:phosphate transport system protein